MGHMVTDLTGGLMDLMGLRTDLMDLMDLTGLRTGPLTGLMDLTGLHMGPLTGPLTEAAA